MLFFQFVWFLFLENFLLEVHNYLYYKNFHGTIILMRNAVSEYTCCKEFIKFRENIEGSMLHSRADRPFCN